MATSKGWNSLSPQQQANFKAKNFNMKVRVTESQLDKLRKEGTPTKAIAKYKNDASMREALNRFYGKDRVAKAIGTKTRGYTNAQLEAAKKRKPAGPKLPGISKPRPSSNKPSTAVKPKTNKSTSNKKEDPRVGMGKYYARGPIPTQAGINQLAKKWKTDPEDRKRQDRVAAGIVTAASIIPAVRGARLAGAAYKAARLVKNRKAIGTVVRVTKDTGPKAIGPSKTRLAITSGKSTTKTTSKSATKSKSPTRNVKTTTNAGSRRATRTGNTTTTRGPSRTAKRTTPSKEARRSQVTGRPVKTTSKTNPRKK